MRVLHAGVLADDTFAMWAEQSSETPAPVTSPSAAPSPAPSSPPALRRLPFGATTASLRATMTELGIGVAATIDEPRIVWLPSLDGEPFASNPAVARLPLLSDGQDCKLEGFTVDALSLPFRAALGVCLRLFDRPATQDDVVQGDVALGDDLLAWVHAVRFAASLVLRQRYLPGSRVTGDVVRSRWLARIEGADAATLTAIAKGLPTVARAVTVDATPPSPSGAMTTVRRFVEEAVDALVRDGAAEAMDLGRATVSSSTVTRRSVNVHDEWLTSLASRSGELRVPPEEARALAEAIATWQRPVALVANAPVRVVFRLEEPTAETWTLRTLLRSKEDPTQLLPLDPREHALIAIAQAATISPLIARGLHREIAETVDLTLDEAHLFLTQHAPALEQAGFQVLLPSWWTERAARLRLAAHARGARSAMDSVGAGLTLDSLVDVDWKAALGDQEMSLPELKALALLKAPLLQVRGRWVEVDAAQLRAAITFFERGTREQRSVRELLSMKLGAAGTAGENDKLLPVADVGGDGAVGDLLARLDGNALFSEQPEPPGFIGTLRPYQRRGWSWLKFLCDWGLGACLADDMGLGKTIQALALLQSARNGGERRPALLVCPTSVVGNWQREAARFTPGLEVLIHHGLERARAGDFVGAARRHALVLTSYALLHRDLEQFAPIAWAGVILDEAQNIKNPETKQARAARSLTADWRLALTGTPVENHVGDLWSIMQFLNPGLLGSQEGFRREFLRPIQLGGDREAGARLRRRTGPFVLRRLKSDPLIAPELPAKFEHDVVCNLTREQASLYAATVDDAQERIASAEGIERRGRILALLTRLKQICNHPVHFLADGSPLAGRSGKLERLVEMLEEACDEGDRSLVFTQYREMGELLEQALRERLGREVLFLHGGTPRKVREQMVDRFQAEEGGPPIFLLSLKAGGTGLNLTRASHVFHYDRWWNPAVEDQATDRAHRIGQTRRVQVHKLVCAGTLEERIDSLIQKKRGIAEQVIGSGEAWLTELSTTELKDLVALGDDAVSET